MKAELRDIRTGKILQTLEGVTSMMEREGKQAVIHHAADDIGCTVKVVSLKEVRVVMLIE